MLRIVAGHQPIQTAAIREGLVVAACRQAADVVIVTPLTRCGSSQRRFLGANQTAGSVSSR